MLEQVTLLDLAAMLHLAGSGDGFAVVHNDCHPRASTHRRPAAETTTSYTDFEATALPRRLHAVCVHPPPVPNRIVLDEHAVVYPVKFRAFLDRHLATSVAV